MDIFHIFFYIPIANILVGLYHLFGGNIGLAILAIALITKLITLPITRRSNNSMKKMKDLNDQVASIKKQYKNDPDKQNTEMARVQMKQLPVMLGGCLNFIIIIIMVIQVRNVLINIFNEGWHAYNEVAISQDWKLAEDSVTSKFPQALDFGTHTISYKIKSNGGKEINKEIQFGIVESEDKKNDLSNQMKSTFDNKSQEEKDAYNRNLEEQRKSTISIFIKEFNGQGQFPVVVGKKDNLVAFLRPPSRDTIDYAAVEVSIDGKQLDKSALTNTVGEAFNIDFLGMDLSRVATDVGFSSIAVLPYVILAILVAGSQYLQTKIQTKLTAPSKPKTKKKDKNNEEPGLSDMIQQSTTTQMGIMLPAFTGLFSLGLFGGGLFPAGVSLFWTGQSTFAIIEQLLLQNPNFWKDFKTKVKAKISSITSRKNDQGREAGN